MNSTESIAALRAADELAKRRIDYLIQSELRRRQLLQEVDQPVGYEWFITACMITVVIAFALILLTTCSR